MSQLSLSLMLAVLQALMSVTLLASAQQGVCPYQWYEQPRDEELPCDPQGGYIRMKCSVYSMAQEITVNWLSTKNVTDAGINGNEIVNDGMVFILSSGDSENIYFTSVFFQAEESTLGYYWCEINGTSLNVTSSSIVAMTINSSLPLCKDIAVPYDPPSNNNTVCAVEGFSAAALSSLGLSTTPYANVAAKSSFLPSITSTTALLETSPSSAHLFNITSSSGVISSSASLLNYISSSQVISSVSDTITAITYLSSASEAELIASPLSSDISSSPLSVSKVVTLIATETLDEFSTTESSTSLYELPAYLPSAPPVSILVMTSLDLQTVSSSGTPEASVTVPIPLTFILLGTCIPSVIGVTVLCLIIVTVFCCRKRSSKQLSVMSYNSNLTMNSISISQSLEHVPAIVHSQTLKETELTDEKIDLAGSLDLSSLQESHIYVNSSVFFNKTSMKSDEGYADPKQLTDLTSSAQFKQNSTLGRGQASTSYPSSYPRTKRSRSVNSDEGLTFTNPTTGSSAMKPEPQYADPKKLFSASSSATNLQHLPKETQESGESLNGYTIPFGCVPPSAKQRLNSAYPPPTQCSSTVQYSHLKPIPEKEAGATKIIPSSARSKSSSEEPGYADPWDIMGAVPTGVKHGSIKRTSREARLGPPRRSNTLPQIGLRTLGAPQDKVGEGQQLSETQQGPLHSPAADQHPTGGQWTRSTSTSVSSLDENCYDDPWDLMKNIPTGVRRGTSKKRSATLRSRPKPAVIESVDNDPKS